NSSGRRLFLLANDSFLKAFCVRLRNTTRLLCVSLSARRAAKALFSVGETRVLASRCFGRVPAIAGNTPLMPHMNICYHKRGRGGYASICNRAGDPGCGEFVGR